MLSKIQDQPLLLFVRAALRWRLAVRIFSVCVVLSTCATLLVPNTYEARFKVMLRLNAATASDIANQATFSAEEIRRSRLNTEIQLITADDVLRQVVADSHLEDAIGLTRRPLAVRQQAALQQLERDLTVRVVAGSNVIEATYDSSSPERAGDVLRRIFDAYLRTHRHHSRSTGAYQALLDAYPALHAVTLPPETQLSALTRQQAKVRRNQQRSEGARLSAQALEQHSLSDLVILDQPFTPQLASSPRRGFLLGLAFVGSLLIPVVGTLCLEWLSGRVQNPATIAQLTGMPLLASIPSNAATPPFADAFPALYLAMQRPRLTFLGRLS